MSAPRTTEAKLMNFTEWLTIRVNYARSQRQEKVRSKGLANYFVVGKGIYYIHNGLTDSQGNVLNLKYLLVRPDINYSESGTFDYTPGFPLEAYIEDNYFSHNFDEF